MPVGPPPQDVLPDFIEEIKGTLSEMDECLTQRSKDLDESIGEVAETLNDWDTQFEGMGDKIDELSEDMRRRFLSIEDALARLEALCED